MRSIDSLTKMDWKKYLQVHGLCKPIYRRLVICFLLFFASKSFLYISKRELYSEVYMAKFHINKHLSLNIKFMSI